MRLKAVAFMWACALGFNPAFASDKTPRIVSTSLCGDSYVSQVIAPDHVAAMSWQVRDKVSNAPRAYRDKLTAWDDAERLIALKPSLVIFGPGEGFKTKPFLEAAGIASVSLSWGEDFDIISQNFKTLTDATPQSVTWENVKAWQSPPVSPPPSTSAPKVLYLSSSGASAGPGTYVDAVIRAAGGQNVLTTAGWHTPDVEYLVTLKPDIIVTSFFDGSYASVNETGLRHAAVRKMIEKTPHVTVPGRLWPCAGPGLYEASDIIRTAIEGLGHE